MISPSTSSSSKSSSLATAANRWTGLASLGWKTAQKRVKSASYTVRSSTRKVCEQVVRWRLQTVFHFPGGTLLLRPRSGWVGHKGLSQSML
jgi:hypothetical protein